MEKLLKLNMSTQFFLIHDFYKIVRKFMTKKLLFTKIVIRM